MLFRDAYIIYPGLYTHILDNPPPLSLLILIVDSRADSLSHMTRVDEAPENQLSNQNPSQHRKEIPNIHRHHKKHSSPNQLVEGNKEG